MATSREAKQELIPHITFPIPSLKDLPRNLSKEERLETIIANLDKQQQATRLKIIEAAKIKLQEYHTSNQGEEKDADRMDTATPAGPDGMEVFLSNLHTPYLDSMGDPCCLPSHAHLLEGMSVGIPQKTPPIEMQIAKDTLDQIALYDAHALPARKFYADALSRSKGVSVVTGSGVVATAPDPRRTNSGGGSMDPRRPSTGGPSSAPPSRASSGTFTAAGRVDPRLLNRQGSGTFQQTPVQSPVERDANRASDPRLRGR